MHSLLRYLSHFSRWGLRGCGVEINVLTLDQLNVDIHLNERQRASLPTPPASVANLHVHVCLSRKPTWPQGLLATITLCYSTVSERACIHTNRKSRAVSRRKNTGYQQCTYLFVDSLPHYEFFIVAEANKASVLCCFSCHKT